MPTVRDAGLEDAEAVARVRHASWLVAYRDLFPAEQLAAIDVDEWIRRSRQTFRGVPPAGEHRLVSIDDDGTVVAMAACGPAREPDGDLTGQLYAICAHPDAWGQGHGHALIEEVHRRLSAAGHARAMLRVAAGNDGTIAWYERHGWQLDGTVRRGEHAGGIEVEELRMVRDLRRTTPA